MSGAMIDHKLDVFTLRWGGLFKDRKGVCLASVDHTTFIGFLQ